MRNPSLPLALVLSACIGLVACQQNVDLQPPQPTPSPTVTPSTTPSDTPLPSPTASPSPTTVPTTSPSITPAPICPSLASWNAEHWTQYQLGSQVEHNGRHYQLVALGAQHWEPGSSLGDHSWERISLDCTVDGSQPTPTPGLPIDPGKPKASIPKRTLVGYWHNFENGSGYIPLANVSRDWDIINISFAEDKRGGKPGEVSLTLCPVQECKNVESEQEFRAAVRQLQNEGKIVLLSLGGANVHLSLDSTLHRDNFIRTMGDIIADYGFDGMDIDLEGASLIMLGNDTIANPVTNNIVYLIEATEALIERFGDDFILTMAPETAYVQGGYASFGGVWGAYLPLIHGLREHLDLLHVQHYNTGSLTAADGGIYYPGSVDFHVALTDMMITGFDAGMDPSNPFPGLRADQLAIGLPSGLRSASNGFTSTQVAQDAVRCLVLGENCGKYQPTQTHPDFRGLMTWSINWDRYDGYNFSKPHRAFLDSLPD